MNPADDSLRIRIEKDLCVVGHGRGATTYAAKWLQRNGIAVDHECMTRQGIVESGFAIPNWGLRDHSLHAKLTRDAFRFKAKCCILRDPYKVISTFYSVEVPTAIWWHARCLPAIMREFKLPADMLLGEFLTTKAGEMAVAEDPILRINMVARSVILWTQSGITWCDGWAFRAEDEWNALMPEWLDKRGLWPGKVGEVQQPPPGVNHTPGTRLDRAEIDALLYGEVLEELAAFRKRLGYGTSGD